MNLNYNIHNIEKITGMKILCCKDCGRLPVIYTTKESEYSWTKVAIGCSEEYNWQNRIPPCRCMSLMSTEKAFTYDEDGLKRAVSWWNEQQTSD